jgi:hypothetical protein
MGTVRHDDSIGRLCIALAHRWEPQRLFVIFTAYFDESGTHSRTPTMILGAFLGHAYQWRRFEKKLPRIQAKYGFKVFHAKDFKARKREFAAWPEENYSGLIRDLTELVRDNLTEGVTVFLPHDRYMQEYRAPPVPKGMNLDSQMGVCFRACLGRMLQRLEARGNHDQLNVVMEAGHHNVGNCEDIFHSFRRRWAKEGVNIFGTFTTAGKEDCPPLMVADMLAFAHGLVLAQTETHTRFPPQYVLPEPGQRTGVLAFLELQPDALRELKAGFVALKEHEADQWRVARDARRAASGASA